MKEKCLESIKNEDTQIQSTVGTGIFICFLAVFGALLFISRAIIDFRMKDYLQGIFMVIVLVLYLGLCVLVLKWLRKSYVKRERRLMRDMREVKNDSPLAKIKEMRLD